MDLNPEDLLVTALAYQSGAGLQTSHTQTNLTVHGNDSPGVPKQGLQATEMAHLTHDAQA
eukprot:9568579-Ditylum_brightwellii.AAC.1